MTMNKEELLEQTKLDVVYGAQEMLRSGLVAAVWGNVSARVPGTDWIVVTPSGVEYATMTADMTCVIDLQSAEQIGGALKPTSELKMHLAIYRARPDVHGIMHTHSTYCSAFSVAHKDIQPVVEDLAQVVGGSVSCAKYALPGTDELGAHTVKALGRKGAVLLANHGMVGVGPTVAEALRVCQIVEKGAKIHAIAKLIGNPVLLSLEDVEWLRDAYTNSYGQDK